ncbi:MAG: 2-dehydro-3-deoxygalactonokinase [Actinomycetales bacterium]|nr:2-dehydro-3-deoxygalactonokinase [Actinomycetales bacterium]
MTNRNDARLIALDWGTTSCRAYLMAEGGVVLAERRQPLGTMAVTRHASATGTPHVLAFEQSFEEICGGWLESDPDLPVIACGMVGSNHGWAEADYRAVPADLVSEGIVLTRVSTRRGVTVHIIPGLIADSALPGVMRGEETQILGALTANLRAGTLDYASERIVLLPGTHSKWVRIIGTTVKDFATYMTGEIYALLTTDSTLSRLSVRPVQSDWMAFDRGLDVARSPAGRGGVLNTAFSARSLVITGELAPDQVEDYISGLLIGHELAEIDPAWLADEPNAILLCGEAALNDRYRRALQRLGVDVDLAVPGSAPLGMWEIAQITGLLTLVKQ